MNTQQKIETILKQSFNPSHLEVINESYKHAGHGGDDGTGESHFKIIISAKDVSGSTRLEKHRAINSAIYQIAKNIHALSIELATNATSIKN